MSKDILTHFNIKIEDIKGKMTQKDYREIMGIKK